ncbi:MAG TPA: long-chain-fatty-acid--CoA ligase [Rhizomicrobium sp.]|nr:long-chain-fatty-acid--CoA ligase [Rhizomicrobium sp.]
MKGLMQDWPLTVPKVLSHAARFHGSRELVSAALEGAPARTSWESVEIRARRLASALGRRGFSQGDRIATLAFNSARHIECWYAVAGTGAVYHTLNPRLLPEQIAWIANHAGDCALFFDPFLADIVVKLAPLMPGVRLYVALTDRAGLPAAALPDLIAYEDLVAEGDGNFAWPELDENTACGLCYTSGTTGDPKGVLYSHRSNVLHAMMGCSADTLAFTAKDTVLPVVPMFHANGWGIPFAAAMAGAKLVLPGPRLDGASLCRLFTEEKVTLTAAVPTVWLGMLRHLDETGTRLPHLKKIVIGGAACPRAMIDAFERKHGIEVVHSWGMTEMSPIGTVGSLTATTEALPWEQRLDVKARQGRPPFGVEMKITDIEGRELPRDGVTSGRLKVRGPAVAGAYFRNADASPFDAAGWFDTGDVATLDQDGIMTVTDRAKDVIKSGGEWISSIQIESLAMSHPAVAEAAVIGVKHPKWDERPLLIVVLKPGQSAAKGDILAFLTGKIAKWWVPDEVVFVDSIPHSATGKIQKTALRERFAGFVLPQ